MQTELPTNYCRFLFVSGLPKTQCSDGDGFGAFGAPCAEVVALAVDESEQWLFSASADKAMVHGST